MLVDPEDVYKCYVCGNEVIIPGSRWDYVDFVTCSTTCTETLKNSFKTKYEKNTDKNNVG